MSDKLTRAGRQLRTRIEQVTGAELSEEEMVDSLLEADERISAGPGGACRGCGATGVDQRYGWCFECVTKAET